MKPDFLHRFVLAMDKGEVTAFRASEHLNTGKWSKQRKQLFNTLLKMGVYDPKSLEKAVTDVKYLKLLATEKNRMLSALIACVMDSRQKRKGDVGPWDKLRESRLLVDMGLTEEAAAKAEEGIVLAQKVEDLFVELQLREQLRAVYKLLPRFDNMDAITENEYSLETLVQKVANLTRYAVICDNIGDHLKKYRVSDDQSVRSAMNELFDDKQMSGIDRAISLTAQIRYTMAKALYFDFVGDIENAQEQFADCIDLWETNPERIAYKPHFYRQALSNLIGVLVQQGKTNEIPTLIERMEQVPIAGRRASMLAFCDVELQYQYYYMNMGQIEEVVKRENGVKKGLQNFGKMMVESKELTLLYNLGVSYLILGNDKVAKDYFNCIRDKGTLHSRLDLQGLARIFRLLFLLEEDKDDRFHYYLRSYKRTFRKDMPFYKLEDTIFVWLKKHCRHYHSAERKRILVELHDKLVDFEMQRFTGAEELRLWAQSRAENKPIRALLQL